MNIIEAKQASMKDIKANLKMAYVMDQYGHDPDYVDTDGKLHYVSPFRADEHPSFDIFLHSIAGRKEEERFADFADPDLNQGDVVDLVAKFEGCTVGLAIGKARDLLVSQIEEAWAGPVPRKSEYRVLDMSSVQDLIEHGRPLDSSDNMFNLAHTHPGLSEVVLPSDRVFLHPQHDTIVLLLWDDQREIRGVRFRNAEGKKWSLKGSKNILMRLEDPTDKPVFLVEGETDLYAAYGALHQDYEVIGVPGVSNQPEKVGAASLAGRTVYVCFDPDQAGIKGRQKWVSYLETVGCTVKTVILLEGSDVAELDASIIAKLPDRARTLSPAPEKFVRNGDTYAALFARKDDVTFDAKTNWSFIPEKVLIGEETRAFRGTLLPSGKTVTLPDSALTTAAALKSWGAQYQARWFGSDAQVQQLAALLDHEAAFLPEGRVHDQVGLYEGSFVWPNGYIGQPVEYVPTVAGSRMGPDKIFLKDSPSEIHETFLALYHSQHPAVTTPILAWLAAAPIRTLFTEFPVLNITGASGSGKSALTKEFLRVFSSTHLATTLSSTTPHGVSTQIDDSNGFPVWFDEYRPGAREDAKVKLDQLLRDGYTMQLSSKGGQHASNLSKLGYIRTAAPVIVSGEDSFTETSHTDRMVMVRLRQSEQGKLGSLKDLDTAGFGHAYLRSLTRPGFGDAPDTKPAVFEKPPLWRYQAEDVVERQDSNLRVLKYGWSLLCSFLEMSAGRFLDLPDLDLSRVIDAGVEASQSNPVLELIKLCLEGDTKEDVVWKDDDFVYVRTQLLLNENRTHPSIILPVSNAKGLATLLVDQHGGEGSENKHTTPGSQYGPPKRVRAVRLPLSVLD